MRVLIIGAGASGIACATKLRHAGHDTLIIEARDRIGGRMCTVDTPAGAVELGGEFVHGEPLPAFRHTRLPCTKVDETPKRLVGHRAEAHPELFDLLERVLAPIEQARDDEAFATLLERSHGVSATMRRMLTRFVEGFNGADASRIGARGLLRQLRAPGGGGPHRRFDGGYGALLDRLQRAAGPIQLHAQVTFLRHRAAGIRIDLDDVQMFADAAVVTVPLGVLQRHSIVFDPPLKAKRPALERLIMGDARRITLRLDADVWRERGILQVERDGFDVFWRSGPALLTAWCGGPRALALQGASLEALVSDALAGLAIVLGRALPQELVHGAYTHDWARDPLSVGAYSYVGIGGDGAAAALAEPVNERLYFAGEACDAESPGSVDGAWRSGERAARRFLRDHGSAIAYA